MDPFPLDGATQGLPEHSVAADPTLDPLGPAHSQPGRHAPGTMVGPYKLLEQIGGGGMGVVYMAEQLRPVRRKVALKIIKPGMDSSQVIARFEAERQALTMMDHPNIAKVLDAGTTDIGRPYFVMELVKGVPITDYCDQATLTTRQRLELFIEVCRAVQHAHQKGVIHRDLKPSNVLVTLHDDKPVPKVIDFGIAKAAGQQLTERTLFTNYAQMLGTPLYMSPEQAQISGLDVDTRSDVYSLGVLLYELLTGTTPFDQRRLREAAYDEMRRIIREEDPPNPSTRLSTMGDKLATVSAQRHTEPKKLGQLVRGELDWIVMKALEKDRTRRYETANGLARDVERHLSDEAVHACPPSAGYRFRKFARRNKRPLVGATLLAIVLVLGSVISTWQALRARRAEAMSQLRFEAEKDARARAVTEAAKANTVSDLLQEMLSSANPDEAKGVDYTVRQLLDDSALRLSDQLKGQPEVEAAVRAAIGNAYRRLGLTDKADPHLQRALSLRRTTASAAADKEAADLLLAQSLLDYGWNCDEAGRAAEAEPHLREALAIYKANGGAGAKVIETLATLQLCVDQQRRWADAEAVANEALALGQERFPEGHAELANVLHRLGGLKQAQGDLVAAEPLIRKAVDMHRRWHGKDHPETGWSLSVLGDLVSRQGKHDEAEACYREALAIFSKQYDETHAFVLRLVERLDGALLAKGDEAGLATLRADRAVRLSKAVERGTDTLKARIQLARFLRDTGHLDEAIVSFSEAVKLASTPDVKHRLADELAQLARLLRDKQKPQQSEQAFREAIALREPLAKSASASLRLAQSSDYNDMAFVLVPATRLTEAEHAVRCGLALKQALVLEFPENSEYRLHLAHSYLGLGYIVAAAGRTPDGVEATGKAADILNALAGQGAALEQSVFLGHTFWQLADAWLKLNHLEDARDANEKAMQAFTALASKFPTNLFYRQEQGFTHRKLADVAQRGGRIDGAEGHLRSALSLYRGLVAAVPAHAFYQQEATYTAEALADAHAQLGQPSKAAEDLVWALETSKLADQSDTLSRLALLRLATQDEGAYRQTCSTLMTQSLPKNPDGNAAFQLAWTCCLLPDAGVDTAQVVRIAERAVARNAKDPDYLIALGAALYRAGRLHEAAKTLADAEAAYSREQATPTPGIYVTTTVTYSHLFLAMTHHRLGQHEQATKWLKQAVEFMDSVPPATRPSVDRTWTRRLTLQVLRNQAEALTTPATD
jgi:eukaryotic-like serine/threonine-protein kinase